MPITIGASTEGCETEGPYGLRVFIGAFTDDFGTIYYGRSRDMRAAGVWSEKLPLAYVPERADELLKGTARLRSEPITFDVEGVAGRFSQSNMKLVAPWSRRLRAVHVEVGDRKYAYYLRWWNKVLVSKDAGGVDVLWRRGYGNVRVASGVDEMDVAVGLLTTWAVADSRIEFASARRG